MTNGTKVQITGTSNEFARKDIGQVGTIIGEAPLGMLIVLLSDGREFWASRGNLARVAA